jgi:hypothetical protein
MLMRRLDSTILTITATAALVALASLAPAAAPRPEAPWPGPRGEFVFLEGESFAAEGPGWRVIAAADRPALTKTHELGPAIWGPHMSAGAMLAGSAEGAGVARATIDVPAAARYTLWVRHSQWPNEAADKHLAPFALRIAPAVGDPVEHVFAAGRTGPPLARKAVWNAELVWTKIEVALPAGVTTVELAKVGGTGRVSATLRGLDCLLLTTDADYVPDHRDFGLQTYLRATLEEPTPKPAFLYGCMNSMLPPHIENVSFSRLGFRPTPLAPASQLLAVGESTPWMNVSRMMRQECEAVLRVQAIHTWPDKAEVSGYRLDFATAPRDDAVERTIRRSGPGAGIRVRVGGARMFGDLPKADHEFAAEQLAMAERLPAPGFGRRPTRIEIRGEFAALDGTFSPPALELERKIAAWLGINAKPGIVDDDDVAAGLLHGALGGAAWFFKGKGRHSSSFFEPDLGRMEESLARKGAEARAAPHPDRLRSVKLNDEAAPLPLEPFFTGLEVNHEVFARYVADRGIDLGSETAGGPPRLTADRSQPRSYYHSQKLRAWSIARFFHTATGFVREHYPPGARSTQLIADASVFHGSLYDQGNDYWVYARERALDLIETEDWSNLACTDQLAGWNAALLRAATAGTDIPTHMAVITGFGRPPLVVKLKASAALAQGVRSFQMYSYSPPYGWHEPGWATNYAVYPAVAEWTREVGAAEHVLADAAPRRARVAILYNRAHDVWNNSSRDDATQLFARLYTYLLLRHSQVAVDVLDDETVAAGGLAGYEVAYLYGAQVERAMLPPLVAWVRDGGTLVLGPGAASRDEYDQPTDLLDAGLGLGRGEARQLQRVYHTTAWVNRQLQPKGTVTLVAAAAASEPAGRADAKAATVPLYAWTQTFPEREGVVVEARDAEGKAVAVRQPAGRGAVHLRGFLAELAAVRDAFIDYERRADEPVRPLPAVAAAMIACGRSTAATPDDVRVPRKQHAPFPATYAGAAMRFAIGPAVAPAREVVAIDPAGDPLPVEATFLEGPAGWAVTLANWSGEPLERITLRIRPGRPSGPVATARLGAVPAAREAGEICLEMPLESTDIAFAAWVEP